MLPQMSGLSAHLTTAPSSGAVPYQLFILANSPYPVSHPGQQMLCCRQVDRQCSGGWQGRICFARLKVPAPDGSGSVVDHGVHAFIVPHAQP